MRATAVRVVIGWLTVHVYLALLWSVHGPTWVQWLFVFCVVFDLADYRRTLLKHDADEVHS